MPSINTDAARRQAARELAKSRRCGDYICASGGPATMVVNGKLMRPAPSEAERKAKEHALWLRSIGPW